jgi:hypothetical protein
MIMETRKVLQKHAHRFNRTRLLVRILLLILFLCFVALQWDNMLRISHNLWAYI